MKNTTKFLISSNPENLKTAISGSNSVTVEAEFGSILVSGSILTLAHHGPRSNNPAPCSMPNNCCSCEKPEVIGLSHFDLDTLGGCMAVMGVKPENDDFWNLIGFVDVHGVHHVDEANASPENIRRLHALWAWSENFRVFSPRDGSVEDITQKIQEGFRIIEAVLNDDEELLIAGDAFKKAGELLNAESLIETNDGLVLRKHEKFVNHLYTTPDGNVNKAVLAFNTARQAITLSFADSSNLSACTILQSIWGNEAGGHAGIAGSPRGQEMTEEDFEKAKNAVIEALKK